MYHINPSICWPMHCIARLDTGQVENSCSCSCTMCFVLEVLLPCAMYTRGSFAFMYKRLFCLVPSTVYTRGSFARLKYQEALVPCGGQEALVLATNVNKRPNMSEANQSQL